MILALVLVISDVVLLVILGGLAYFGAVTGTLVLDVGWGRRLRPLGPLCVQIAADRAAVYGLLTQPYLGRTSRAMAEKVHVLDRGSDMVLAAHRTPIRGRLVAVTVETVTFVPDQRIGFRLVRGPVPYVEETFMLTDTETGCRLDYDGQLGTDFAALGACWGRLVASQWQATVNATMQAVKTEAERQASRAR